MQTQCPRCSETVSGDLAKITAHVNRCGKVAKRPKLAETVMKRADLAHVHLPLKFAFQLAIPSQNTAGHTKHWSGYQKVRKAWRDVVDYHMRELHGLNLSFSRWHFLRIIPERGKYYDDANLVGGAKALVDALTFHHIIEDDGPQYFKAMYEQEPSVVRHLADGRHEVLTVVTLLEAH